MHELGALATDMNTDSRATQRALETPELLELILTSLAPTDLLMLQRTSRLWNGVINTSPQLLRNLFMRADWTLEGKRNNPKREINKPGERPRNNLMLRRVLGGSYPTMALNFITPETTQFIVSDVSELDADVAPKQPQQDEEPKDGYWAWDVSLSYPAHKQPTSPTVNPTVHHPKASWRRMYLSQPPATTLHLARRWQRAANPAIHCAKGITMEEFIEKASMAKEIWNEQFIGSDGDWHFEGGIKFSHFEPEDDSAHVPHLGPPLSYLS